MILLEYCKTSSTWDNFQRQSAAVEQFCMACSLYAMSWNMTEALESKYPKSAAFVTLQPEQKGWEQPLVQW